VVFISLTGFGVITVPFPLVAEQMGASDFWKTFGGAGIFSLFQLLATPLWGRYSDAIGRKPILLMSLAGSVLAYLWLAYASDLVALLLARALGGIMSGNLSAAFAYATDVTEPKNRARGLGIISSAFGLGFAFGPPIGGFLGMASDGSASLHAPALASAALSLLALLGTWLLLKESHPVSMRRPLRAAPPHSQSQAVGDDAAVAAAGSPFAELFAKPVLVGLMIAALVVAIGSSAMQSVYQFWARDLFNYSLRDVGMQFAAFAVMTATGQAALVGPLVHRFGEKHVALGATAGITVGLILFAIATHPVMCWIAICVLGVALGVFTPSVTSLVSFEADPRSRGAVMGAFNSASSCGRIVGPAVSGPLYFSLGHAAPFLMSAVLTAVGGMLLLRARARIVVAPVSP
jgi:MFS family permease